MRTALLALVLLAASAGCSFPGTAAGASPSPQPKETPAAASPAPLDPEVTMPAGFPQDLPLYPKARLTAAASFTATGKPTAWGVEWETYDGVEKVRVFYASRLAAGDWTITFSGTANGAFAASYSRRSNPKIGGLIGAEAAGGVTRITLSLAS